MSVFASVFKALNICRAWLVDHAVDQPDGLMDYDVMTKGEGDTPVASEIHERNFFIYGLPPM